MARCNDTHSVLLRAITPLEFSSSNGDAAQRHRIQHDKPGSAATSKSWRRVKASAGPDHGVPQISTRRLARGLQGNLDRVAPTC